MYRSFILIFTLLFAWNAQAQETYEMPLKDGKIFYQEVVNQNGTPEELFNLAFNFIKGHFPNFSSVVTKKDKENKVIEGIIRVDIKTTDKKGHVQRAGKIRYEFKIECKANRYRITMYNFRRNDNSGNKLEEWFKDTDEGKKEIHRQHFGQIDTAVKKFINDIKEGMKPKAVVDDTW